MFVKSTKNIQKSPHLFKTVFINRKVSLAQLKQQIMKTIIKLTLVTLSLLVSSCGTHRVYTTGSYASVKSYTDKPLYNGSKESATYVSGDISMGRHEQNDGADFHDAKTLVSGSVYRSTSGKFYNYYYGGGLTYGRYRFTKGYENLIGNREKQNFYNVNLKTGLNFTYNRPKMEYRFIGIEFTYLNEFGSYQDKLDTLDKSGNDGLEIINVNSMFTYNVYSEYVFKKPNSDSGLLIGFYFGDIINYDVEQFGYKAGYSGFLVGLKLNRSTISLISESGNGNITSTKFGFTYQL